MAINKALMVWPLVEELFFPLREAAKKVIFLMSRPLRPYTPPLGPLREEYFLAASLIICKYIHFKCLHQITANL